MHTLYHHSMNPGSRYVRLLLGEYGQKVAFLDEKVWERRPEFLALNPAGTVPLLQLEEGECVCGAVVIGEFLDETCGAMMRDKRLMPEKAANRSETRRLIEWFIHKFDHEVTRYMLQERIYKQLMRTEEGGGPPEASVIRAARNNLKGHMKYLNALAGSRDWMAGRSISAADMAAAAAISVLDYLGEISWEEQPAAKDWYSRLKSRPSFRPLLDEKMLGLPPSSHYGDLDF
ncbi:MAG: glutathione S-transferase family protein [Pseudomonadota bacterium]